MSCLIIKNIESELLCLNVNFTHYKCIDILLYQQSTLVIIIILKYVFKRGKYRF